MSSRVFIISDLHLDHKRILDFSGTTRYGHNVHEHDEWIIAQWNSVVRKRDVVKVLGDVAFSREGLAKCARLNGTKHLTMANHDKYPVEEYMKYFKIKPGLESYKGFWLSHCPIHPCELRGKKNIHGHVHMNSVTYTKPEFGGGYAADPDYINVCVEAVDGVPVLFDDIKEKHG